MKLLQNKNDAMKNEAAFSKLIGKYGLEFETAKWRE